MTTGLDRKFFASTRGRMVTLLRRRGLTVDELAEAVGLTNNGVRAHLAALERDGLVRQRGSVRRSGSGGGKPAYVYELTPQAEDVFPKAYEPVLHRLLDVLSEQAGEKEIRGPAQGGRWPSGGGARRTDRRRAHAARGDRSGAKRAGWTG